MEAVRIHFQVSGAGPPVLLLHGFPQTHRSWDLTSSQEDQDVADCYKLGVNSYIVKPVEFDSSYISATSRSYVPKVLSGGG